MSAVKFLLLFAAAVSAVQAQTGTTPAGTCPPLPTSAPGPYKLTLTADFLYFLYVDGQLIQDPPGYDNVTAPDTVELPQNARLIAIQGQAFQGNAGLLGSVEPNDYFLTGNIDWRCRNTLQAGWELLGLDDSSWPTAYEIGLHGSYPGGKYGCIEGISPNAHWIWTTGYGSPAPLDRNVWCRGQLPLCAKNNPCLNGGTCLPNTAGKICSCPIDYAGERCELDLNQCRSAPCLNGGSCSNTPDGSYFCSCTANYTGSRCETMLNACESAPCLNGGTCLNGGSFYVCNCRPFYTGGRCENTVPYDCGQILHDAENATLPNGWNLGCFIGQGDEIYFNTPCFALLQGLSYYGSSEQLLQSGGNFGCWMTNDPSSSQIYNACADNYQHNIYIRECSVCNFMAVCIRFPQSKAANSRRRRLALKDLN